jgi:hypothetical protein
LEGLTFCLFPSNERKVWREIKAFSLRSTDNTMAKTLIYKIIHRKLKIEHHVSH